MMCTDTFRGVSTLLSFNAPPSDVMPLSTFLMMQGCSTTEMARDGMGNHGAGCLPSAWLTETETGTRAEGIIMGASVDESSGLESQLPVLHVQGYRRGGCRLLAAQLCTATARRLCDNGRLCTPSYSPVIALRSPTVAGGVVLRLCCRRWAFHCVLVRGVLATARLGPFLVRCPDGGAPPTFLLSAHRTPKPCVRRTSSRLELLHLFARASPPSISSPSPPPPIVPGPWLPRRSLPLAASS